MAASDTGCLVRAFDFDHLDAVITAWRLAAPEFAGSVQQLLSGEGARLYGGRWNSPGVGAVYLGNSLALASIELLVHLRSIDVLEAYCKMPVFIPESLVLHLDSALLPADWAASEGRRGTRAIGDEWLRRGESAVLQVPSAVVAGETNFILNPTHADFAAIKAGAITEFRFDARLGTKRA